MMTRIRQRFFSLRHTYGNPLDRQRAQVLLFLDIVIVIVTVLTILLLQLPDLLTSGYVDVAGFISSIVVVIAAVFSYRFIQQGRLSVAIWIVMIAITLGTVSAVIFSNDGTPNISSTVIIFLPVPIIAAAMLLNRSGLVAITLFTLLGTGAAAIFQTAVRKPVITIPADVAVTDFVLIAISVLIILSLLIAFLGTLQRVASESIEIGKQRQLINKLGLELGSATTENEILGIAVNQSRQIFNQPFVDIYLSDDDGNLKNAAASGQRRTVIRSIESNIIAEAARSRALMTTSLKDDPARRTHMAASTSFAAAVPLIVGVDLIGVMDFQGVAAFTANELDSFQQLADQIALGLHRVRHTSELESRVVDHEKTINRLQSQVQDVTRRQRQNVAEVWGSYVEGRGRQAIGYNLEGDAASPIQATDLPSGLAATLKSGQLEVATEGNNQIINVPIRFRDTNLGAMSFSVPVDQQVSDYQIEVATIVAERLALALENTRLFEQSQSQALRERKASEVATALIGATDVRVVLNMAAEQFKDALGAVNTRIYIQPETLTEPLAQTQQENQ